MIGLIVDPEMSAESKKLIAEKRAAYDSRKKKITASESEPAADPAAAPPTAAEGEYAFPPSASMCHKCTTKAVIIMDGCATCLNCGYSKCG
jgi:cytochrome c5